MVSIQKHRCSVICYFYTFISGLLEDLEVEDIQYGAHDLSYSLFRCNLSVTAPQCYYFHFSTYIVPS